MTDTAAPDGRSTRWDPHRRERRAKIIAAAIAAVEEHGPDALTAQIAEIAGVPRTHVYRHFDGKQALDFAVARTVSIDIGHSIRAGFTGQGTARDIIRGAVSQHLSWIEAHPNLYQFLTRRSYAIAMTGVRLTDNAQAALAAELTTLFAGYLSLFGVDPAPAERIIVGVVGMADTTAAWWLERRDIPREQLTAELTEHIWLIIDHTARSVGLTVDPDAILPPLPR